MDARRLGEDPDIDAAAVYGVLDRVLDEVHEHLPE
jgi:hypothetical protein